MFSWGLGLASSILEDCGETLAKNIVDTVNYGITNWPF